MKDMLVVGDDKLGRALLSEIKSSSNIVIVLDRSSSLKRLVSLIKRDVISIRLVLKMAIANLLRNRCSLPMLPYEVIHNNSDLMKLIRMHNPECITLFRAGLIINRKVISSVKSVNNIHCARIPEYGGLGTVQKILDDQAYEQVATLHRVTTTIDEGEVLDTEPFTLNPEISYRQNEDIAYTAGIKLATRVLAKYCI